MTLAPLDRVYACAAVLVAVAILLFLRLRNRDPERIERRRRERIERIGRLAQCEILEILETEPAGPSLGLRARLNWLIPAKTPRPAGELIVYRYMVSGVTYETAQDFPASSAQTQLPLAGQVASVKYDPANPSNSFLMIGSWLARKTGAANTAASRKGK